MLQTIFLNDEDNSKLAWDLALWLLPRGQQKLQLQMVLPHHFPSQKILSQHILLCSVDSFYWASVAHSGVLIGGWPLLLFLWPSVAACFVPQHWREETVYTHCRLPLFYLPWTPSSSLFVNTQDSWWNGSGPAPCLLSVSALWTCSRLKQSAAHCLRELKPSDTLWVSTHEKLHLSI